MATNNTHRLILILTLIVLASCKTCKEQVACREVKYTFEGTFLVTPDTDSIRVGDTIFLESTVPYFLQDLITGQTVEFRGSVNVGTMVAFDKLLGNNNIEHCADCFELKPIEGEFLPHHVLPSRNRNYVFSQSPSGYKFRLAIIAKVTGDFVFAFNDAGPSYPKDDDCMKANFQYKMKNTDQHFYIYQSHRPGYVLSNYEQNHMYCFRVY